jgi:hypothetical protein
LSFPVLVPCLPRETVEMFSAISATLERASKAFEPITRQAKQLEQIGQALTRRLVAIGKALKASALRKTRAGWARLARRAVRPRLLVGLPSRILGGLLVGSPPLPVSLSLMSIHLGSNAPPDDYRNRSMRPLETDGKAVSHKLEVKSKRDL